MEIPTFVEEIDYRELQFGEIVGKGAFGVVSRAKWRGKDVAVKRIETESERKAFMQELKQLSRVSHQNIVCLYGARREHPVCLVMEYAEGGSLYNVLHGSGPQPHYTPAHAMSWLLQCARGVEYLHAMKPKALVHRDLKPPNLLLIQYGTVLKICDFGTACDIQTHMTNNKGSAAWMAPEVFEGSNYSEKCDVFSWGIIMWEVFTRRKPFDEIGGPAFRIMWAVHNGKRPPLIQSLPKPLEVLMTKCWSGNPAERPAMSEVVRIMVYLFQFFQGADQPLTIPRNSSVDSDEEFSLSNIPRSNIATPTNNDNVHMASPPIGESRAGTISDTVRYQDMDNSPPIFRHPLPRGTPPVVVEEKKRGQNSAPPSLAASRESLHDPRSRSGTPVDSSKRYSADLSQLDEHDLGSISQGAATAQRVLGHRRSGSHGTTPIFVSTGPPLAPNPGLGRYASYDALVPSTNPGTPSIIVTPSPGYGHRRIGSDEHTGINTLVSPAGPPLSIDTRPQPGMQHCPTYPFELSHTMEFNPAGIPPSRSVSYQAQPQRETMSMFPRSQSESSDQQFQGSNAIIKQGHIDADTNVIGAAINNDLYIALEPHLQPLAPYPTNPESMRIFDQHCQLAQEYMRIQAEIAVLSQRKRELDQEIGEEEPHHMQTTSRLADIEEFTRLSAENESLMKYHSDLKTQVEGYRKNAKRFPASPPRQATANN
ncbi:mitogen-activated protein kinase kinase kinase 7-like isoform X3 [Littorina saxatilis]|uniref:Mitogen-activated protein kinase kinase kinase 7 n=1 Tax=Littorina saxatilis TaxID=31220 RepID=A0AAN9BQM6_9CAEN